MRCPQKTLKPTRMIVILVTLISILHASPLYAIRDETNQGRWEKPCQNGPDAVVPGFLVNMGPTGARGILKARSFIVKFIFPNTPASNKLQIDDEVYGANGKAFSEHTFGRKVHGIEGPIMDMGLAIEESEGSDDGVLSLMVRRGGQEGEVKIQLEKLGRFGETLSENCPKIQTLRARAYDYLAKHPGGVDSQGRCVETLAFLSSDDPRVFAVGKRLAQAWNKPYDDKTWSWHLGFQGIALGEYTLLTGDKSALRTLQSTMDLLRNCQWKAPNIICYKLEDFIKKNIDVDQQTLQKHMDLYDGGFGHAPYTSVIVPRGGGGYGPMQWPTLLAIDAWQLGKLCGLRENHTGLDDAFKFVEHGTTVSGHVAYGGEFTLNNGPVDPDRWKTNTGNSYSHKSGLAYLSYMLSPDRPDSAQMMRLHLSNIAACYRDMPDGHADAMMGLTWGLAGVLASDDEALKKEVSRYYIAWFNMARCAGSDSYVILPGRDYADLAYYRENIRNYTTASVAFIYSFATPRLRIQGVGRRM
ncbi:MAG: hypothetical protein GC164_12725 [Phycisphaera sp.]|nr:hypothetical protein [Phycisphaera sp.]